MIVSIHQPNFMPWLPYFRKIAMCDVFVVLTHCQYEKNGYQNRFNIGDTWYTMSVNKGLVPISAKKYANPLSDWSKIKSGFGNKLDQFDQYVNENLWKMNYDIICHISNKLGIKTKICLDYQTELKSTDRLVDICKTHGATKYIAGSSGTKYMEMNKFSDNNIEVDIQVIQDIDKIPIVDLL